MDLATRGEARRLGLVPQGPLQLPPAPKQAAHYGPLGDPGGFGNLGRGWWLAMATLLGVVVTIVWLPSRSAPARAPEPPAETSVPTAAPV